MKFSLIALLVTLGCALALPTPKDFPDHAAGEDSLSPTPTADLPSASGFPTGHASPLPSGFPEDHDHHHHDHRPGASGIPDAPTATPTVKSHITSGGSDNGEGWGNDNDKGDSGDSSPSGFPVPTGSGLPHPTGRFPHPSGGIPVPSGTAPFPTATLA